MPQEFLVADSRLLNRCKPNNRYQSRIVELQQCTQCQKRVDTRDSERPRCTAGAVWTSTSSMLLSLPVSTLPRSVSSSSSSYPAVALVEKSERRSLIANFHVAMFSASVVSVARNTPRYIEASLDFESSCRAQSLLKILDLGLDVGAECTIVEKLDGAHEDFRDDRAE